MVEFSNNSNYSYILLNNDTIQNQTNKLVFKKELFNLKDLVILIIDIFMVIGPSLGYFLQCLKFKKTKSSKGFSKSICLIIYTSQILRVFFWIGKPFKITLLYQSILVITFQIYLIHLWIKYHKTVDKNKKSNENQINELNYYEKRDLIEYLIDWSDTISPNKIWNWSSQIEYYKFMSLMVFTLLLISGVVGIHNVVLTNIYGTISVISEASTLIPQIIVSCKTKNASNLATSMVALWLIGDSCKFVYNIKYNTPIQMIISGGLQIFLDFFSLMQILCYKDKKKLKKNEIRNVNITTSIKRQKVEQINQFMKRLDSTHDEKNNESYNNSDNSKNVNKIEVIDRHENSDKVEVLDKSRDDQIKYSSDEEDNKNNNQQNEMSEEDNKNENNMTAANLNEEGDFENKNDEN
jgi:uncharacterized protein with PQ loop repeat